MTQPRLTPRPRLAAPPRGPARECAVQVFDAVPAAMDSLRQAMRRHVGDTLSVPQFRCLNHVAMRPGCSVGDVAAFLGVTMPTASAMVVRLVRAGLLAPQVDATDRRRSQLTVTAAGQNQLRSIRRQAHEDIGRTLAHCSVDELDTLSAGLRVLAAALNHSKEQSDVA
jgi:DNA-binding MarR family transcriptional regulator